MVPTPRRSTSARPVVLRVCFKLTSRSRSGEGPVLILIPGTWGDVQSWAPLISRLPSGKAISVIELFWHGGRPLSDGPLDMPLLADAVLRVIEQLRPGPYVLDGISLGGMITVEIAGRHPANLIGAIPMEGWPHHSVAQTAFHGCVHLALKPAQAAEALAARRRRLRHLSSICDFAPDVDLGRHFSYIHSG